MSFLFQGHGATQHKEYNIILDCQNNAVQYNKYIEQNNTIDTLDIMQYKLQRTTGAT